MNPKERFESALKLEDMDMPPVIAPTNSGTLDLMRASKCFWPEAQREVQKMVGLALAAHKVAGIESVTVPFDKYVAAEVMGCDLEGWSQTQQPSAIPVVTGPEDIKKLKSSNPKKDGRMPTVLEAVKILSEKVGDELPIIAAIESPFEIASTLWNPNTMILYIEWDKKPLHDLLSKATELSIKYGKALVKSGASAITVVDGNSQNLFGVPMNIEYVFDGAEPGAEFWEEFSSYYLKKVIKPLKANTVLHICGDTKPIFPHMLEIGFDGLSIDRVDISEVKRMAGDEAAIIGNISVEMLCRGSPEEVKRDSQKSLEQGIDILAPGCNFIPSTPLNNIKAMVAAALEFKRKRENGSGCTARFC